MDENQIKEKDSGVTDIIKFALIVVAIVVPFRLFIAQPYIVEGSSMDPTFKNGDYLIVDQISLHLEAPKRGEVIIMKYPKDPSKFFIKRIIGLPEETVVIKEGKISIKSPGGKDDFPLEENYIVYNKNEDSSATLKKGEYFVMGDNRGASSDSRVWGPLPLKNIVGRPFLRLLPLKNIGIFPGAGSK